MGTRLAGKVCIITGAGSGIGQASALLFAGEGARVVVADVDLKGAQATVERVAGSGGEAIAERRGKRVATVAIARRLVGVLWGMWRHGTTYSAARAGKYPCWEW